MSEAEANSPAPASSPTNAVRSRPYLRLLWIIPALAMLGVGLYYQYNVADGGEVDAIKLTTKQGLVGQASEVAANLSLSSPDLYLKVFLHGNKTPESLPVFENTPIGNGLTWNLSKPHRLHEIERIEVWNHRTILSDSQLDHITMDGWSVDGGKYHVDLLGQRIEPPKWALPLAAVGGALTLLALLKFVWDQVI